MKKYKLLMPLASIAAIGAIAPIVSMSSCHKNENKLVATYEFTEFGGLIGSDKLTPGGHVTLTMKGTLGYVPPIGHSFKKNIKPQASPSKVMKIEAVTGGDVGVWEIKDKHFEADPAFKLIVGSADAIQKFKQGDKDETFTWDVEYEELDGDGLLVRTWMESFSVTIFHKKISIPLFMAPFTGFTATTKTTDTSFKLSGWKFANKLDNVDDAKISVSFKDKTDIDIKEDVTGGTHVLTIKGDYVAPVEKDTQDIQFVASVNPKLTATGQYKFAPTDSTITLEFNNDTNYYVLDKWTVNVEVWDTTLIEVEVTA